MHKWNVWDKIRGSILSVCYISLKLRSARAHLLTTLRSSVVLFVVSWRSVYHFFSCRHLYTYLLSSIVISRSKFISAGMRINNATTIPYAHNLFITLTTLSFHHPFRISEQSWSVSNAWVISVSHKLTHLFIVSWTILVTWLWPSHESSGLCLTSGPISLNHVDWPAVFFSCLMAHD